MANVCLIGQSQVLEEIRTRIYALFKKETYYLDEFSCGVWQSGHVVLSTAASPMENTIAYLVMSVLGRNDIMESVMGMIGLKEMTTAVRGERRWRRGRGDGGGKKGVQPERGGVEGTCSGLGNRLCHLTAYAMRQCKPCTYLGGIGVGSKYK